ncbi:MAG TPA: coenzyme F430 synthase [Methanocella sp.]|nr:coenzyme F430 synthase [Methanocella sp.]
MDLPASRVAVADVNHGGLILAEELACLGYDAFAVDVYGTRSPHDAPVEVVGLREAGRFDALVAPVHMPPNALTERAQQQRIPIYTHHHMTGLIAGATGRLEGMRSVEITGTYGKTTTAFILARLLLAAGERVLLHSSSGLYYDGAPLGKRLSVTPASILRVLDEARAAGADPTVLVAEVSLGGCGTADVGAITTLKDSYPIAGGTGWSAIAKMQMIELAKPGSAVVHDASYTPVGVAGHLAFGAGGDVGYGDDGRIGGPLLAGGGVDLPRADGFDPAAYRQPALCAVTVALALGVKPEAIARGLAGFGGVPGRMKVDRLEGRVLLDNSNSGLSADGIRRALEVGRAHGGRRVLVLGEESYNVCEGLNTEQALKIAADAGVDDVVLVGRRLSAASGARYRCATGLDEGLAAALAVTTPGDVIISCVKTWR